MIGVRKPVSICQKAFINLGLFASDHVLGYLVKDTEAGDMAFMD